MGPDDTVARWGRRFQGFGRALGQLRAALEGRALDEFSDLEREGIALRFEYTFELGWKTSQLQNAVLQLQRSWWAAPWNKAGRACADGGVEGRRRKLGYRRRSKLNGYLEFSGVAIAEATPRKVIKECAASGIFGGAGMDPETYMDMMHTRNALSHTYDFGLFRQAIDKIGAAYLAEFEKQYVFFLSKGPAGDE